VNSSIGKMTVLALALCGPAAISACSRGALPASSAPADPDTTGVLGLALLVAPGIDLPSVNYAITGPGGFAKSGSIDLSNASTLSATLAGIPAGAGYSITLAATLADGTTCGGSATFSVMARATTAVSVAVDCHQPPRNGSIGVVGPVNVCPMIDALAANPNQVPVGSSLSLTASAHDLDSGPAPISYHWSASSGTFSDPASQNPTFTCAAAGTSTVTLTVSDGDTNAGCPDTVTTQVHCSVSISGVVSSVAFAPGSTNDPVVNPGHYQGAKVCVDANSNGACDPAENPVYTDAGGHFTVVLASSAPLTAEIPTAAINSAGGSANPTRNVFRAALGQVLEQGNAVVISPTSTEVVRQMEASGADFGVERQNLATRLGVSTSEVIADVNGLFGAARTAVLNESNVLTGRFGYAITKLDRGDLYPDSLAVPGGNPELTGLPGVTPATATTPETRHPITFQQAEQAAFAVEGIPRYDHIFIVMLENKSTQAMFHSNFAPKINGYLAAGNLASSYYATGNPSEPNYTALGGADDFGITDDSQWNCDATGPNAPQDLPLPTNTQPGLASSPFAATCTQAVGTNHNVVGKPNLFTAITAAGMTWRTYNESMNPGQDIRTDSVADSAVTAPDNVYPPGTLNNNTTTIGNANLILPLPAGLYKTKHHPGMAYQNVRSAPEFKYSNRTLGGGQWDANFSHSAAYAIPPGYDFDQFGTDLASGNVGTLNFVIPDQCDDMHGVTVQGTVPPSTTKITASDCVSVSNNVPVATGGNILTRGDNYVDYLVKKIKASPLWGNAQKKVAIVLMFDEGNATAPDINSCCGWKAGKTAADSPLVQNGSGAWVPDGSNPQYNKGNQGHGKSIFVVLTNQATAPRGIVDNDVYSHFSFVRTLQDMFLLADPTRDASYMNRSKYTEKFIAQNIMNLPEYAGSADTHFDAVRPMNHAYVIPAGYTQRPTADDTRPLQTGPDGTQTNIWAIK
jgi:hypothetical protein